VPDENRENQNDNNTVSGCRMEKGGEPERKYSGASDPPEDPSKPYDERRASGPAFGLVRYRIFGPEPDGTPCEQCGGTDGVVYAIASTVALGERSRSLHEHCAPVWFRAASEPETHTCAHCGCIGGDLGGPGQTWTIGGRDVWLHQGRCEAAYYDAHAGDPPPWQPPEDRPPEPSDQDAPPW
jgi:hypothetical protein